MALFEHNVPTTRRTGAPINSNLARTTWWRFNADVPPIDVHFLDFPDKEIKRAWRTRNRRKSAWPASPPPSRRLSTMPQGFALREAAGGRSRI